MGDRHTDEHQSETFDDYLHVEAIGPDVYRGTGLWRFPLSRSVFGGHLMMQALKAATESTDHQFTAHSLHGYFIKPARNSCHVDYHVDRIRDGATIATRAVRGTQGGMIVVMLTVSFHKPEKAMVAHQDKMPPVPGPETLQSLPELMANLPDRSECTDKIKNNHSQKLPDYPQLVGSAPVIVRPIDPEGYVDCLRIHTGLSTESAARKPRSLVWMKAYIMKDQGDIGPHMPQYVTTFLSDWYMLNAVAQSHPDYHPTLIASLDYSMWFHQSFDPDSWLLCESESPKLYRGRYLTRGRFWTQSGDLVASFSQEGLYTGGYTGNKL